MQTQIQEPKERKGRMQAPRRGTARRAAGLCAAVAVAAFAVGCGSDDEGSSSATASGGSDQENVDLAMVMSFKIPYFIAAQNGAEAAAAADGAVSLDIEASEAPTGVEEVQMAENLLAQGPQGFAVNPCVLQPWNKVMQRMETEVPDNNVIAYSCKQASAPGESSSVKTFIGASDYETGVETVNVAIDGAKLGPDTTGTALVSECAKGTPILDERVRGAEAILAERLPNVKVVNFTTDPADQAANASTWTSVIQNNPDAVIAFGPCDSDTASLVTLKGKGQADFPVSVLDPSEAALEAIKAGTLEGGATSAPWLAGYMTIDLLAKGARGEGTAPEGWIDTGIYKVTAKNVEEHLEASRSAAGQEKLYKPIAEKLLADLDGNVKPLDDSFGGA